MSAPFDPFAPRECPCGGPVVAGLGTCPSCLSRVVMIMSDGCRIWDHPRKDDVRRQPRATIGGAT